MAEWREAVSSAGANRGHARFGAITWLMYLRCVTLSPDLACDASGAVVVSTPTTIAFVAAIVSIVVKEALYQVTVKVSQLCILQPCPMCRNISKYPLGHQIGRNFNSNLVIANAWHHRSDAWSSIVALIGTHVN